MLGFYAGQFPTVEINNTFYRLPKEHVLLDWASQVPEPFTFAIKASQRITHFARLKPDASSAVEFLLKNTSALGAAARADSLPASAEPEEGRRPAARVRRHAADGSPVHGRVSPRELVRRRGLCGAARARHSAVRHRAAGLRVADRDDGDLGIRAAASSRLRRGAARRMEQANRSRNRGARRTCTSSTTRESGRGRRRSTRSSNRSTRRPPREALEPPRSAFAERSTAVLSLAGAP